MAVTNNDKLNKIKDDMKNAVTTNAINMDELISNGVSLRLGGKVFRLMIDESSVLLEDEIKNELHLKLKDKLNTLAGFIDNKMSEAFSLVNSLQAEYQRKEKMLDDKLKRSNPMPDITWDQAKRGLSVIPGDDGSVVWLVRRTYWPKFVDNDLIDPRYQKKMITPVVIKIRSDKSTIKNIEVLRVADLGTFSHYHNNCWGNWNWGAMKINEPEDALKVADYGISVLEKVNTMSIANRNPAGLPKLETLRRNVVRKGHVDELVTQDAVNKGLARSGVDVGSTEDVWSVANS